MFGYVKALSAEMKVREYEFYRATYCGLCRAMGKCTGQCSRLTLSYDMAFLVLARVGSSNRSVELDRAVCIAHPFKKRPYMKTDPALEYCAFAAAILNYHKIKDDLTDERGVRRIAAALALPQAARSRRRALRLGYSALDVAVCQRLEKLSEVEKAEIPSVDEPARIFGELLGDIFAFGEEGDGGRILRALGVSVGKWIYIADALDDWESDARKGRYNPFILLYGKKKPSAEELEGIRIAMKNELVAAESALNLIEIENRDVKAVVENILFLGLPSRIEEITADREKNSRKEKK